MIRTGLSFVWSAPTLETNHGNQSHVVSRDSQGLSERLSDRMVWLVELLTLFLDFACAGPFRIPAQLGARYLFAGFNLPPPSGQR